MFRISCACVKLAIHIIQTTISRVFEIEQGRMMRIIVAGAA
jgi:hypothetical protein